MLTTVHIEPTIANNYCNTTVTTLFCVLHCLYLLSCHNIILSNTSASSGAGSSCGSDRRNTGGHHYTTRSAITVEWITNEPIPLRGEEWALDVLLTLRLFEC